MAAVSETHAYFVRLIITYTKTYMPACSCGWTAPAVDDEVEAAAQAFEHATGKPVPPPETKPTRLRHRQSESMFDPAVYER